MTGLDLRPLSIGEILDRTFSLYRKNFLLFMGIAAIPHILMLALSLTQILILKRPILIGRQGQPQIEMTASGMGVILALLAAVVGILVYLFEQGGTIIAVTEVYLGRTTSIASSLRRVWDDIGSLFGVVVLNGIALFGATLLLVIPGIYLGCRLLVCVPAALVEGRGPRESLSRSWDLTRKYAGRAFVLGLLYFVLIIGIGLLVELPLGYFVEIARHDPAMLRLWLVVQQVCSEAIDVLISPFVLIGTSIFYFDLRVRKEAFDLQFMMDPTSERTTRGNSSLPSILS